MPFAQADESLGDVIRDGIRGEIRDSIGDSVRRDICRRQAERNRRGDLCNTLEDVDRLGDSLRRGSNAIRALDAIFD
jgi:hypothetical protein